jgi:predicted GNAT family acetyltransferase
MAIEVRNDKDETRYVIEVDGTEAGFAAYHLRGGTTYIFYHTVVQEEFEGRGLGTKLAAAALDDVRSMGGSVVPVCPFIAAWLKRHPDYGDLVDDEMLKRFAGKLAKEE